LTDSSASLYTLFEREAMRLILSLARDRKPLSIRAAAETGSDAPVSIRQLASFDIKAVATVLGLILTVATVYRASVTSQAALAARVDTVASHQVEQDAGIARNAAMFEPRTELAHNEEAARELRTLDQTRLDRIESMLLTNCNLTKGPR
jgi:hypothetical protein